MDERQWLSGSLGQRHIGRDEEKTVLRVPPVHRSVLPKSRSEDVGAPVAVLGKELAPVAGPLSILGRPAGLPWYSGGEVDRGRRTERRDNAGCRAFGCLVCGLQRDREIEPPAERWESVEVGRDEAIGIDSQVS